MHLEDTRSFIGTTEAKDDKIVIFGWVKFPSREIRDQANKEVPNDPRMAKIVAPFVNGSKVIFDASRMVYGGFDVIVK